MKHCGYGNISQVLLQMWWNGNVSVTILLQANFPLIIFYCTDENSSEDESRHWHDPSWTNHDRASHWDGFMTSSPAVEPRAGGVAGLRDCARAGCGARRCEKTRAAAQLSSGCEGMWGVCVRCGDCSVCRMLACLPRSFAGRVKWLVLLKLILCF